jgi:hypothetical protein
MDLANRGHLPPMNDPALPENRELVAKFLDFAQDMGTECERATLTPGLAYQSQYLASHRGIQIRGGFIQDHQWARATQNARDREFLAHPG